MLSHEDLEHIERQARNDAEAGKGPQLRLLTEEMSYATALLYGLCNEAYLKAYQQRRDRLQRMGKPFRPSP